MKGKEEMFNSTCYIVFYFSLVLNISTVFVESNDMKKKKERERKSFSHTNLNHFDILNN
jgi:hypothetical protein